MKIKVQTAAIMLLTATTLSAQETDFWFVAPDLAAVSSCSEPADAPMIFVVSNPTGDTAHVRLTVYNGGSPKVYTGVAAPWSVFMQEFVQGVGAGTQSEVENPRSLAGTVTDYGIHITSDVPVTAYYQVIQVCNQDVWSLKGSGALGLEFYVPMVADSYYQAGNYDGARDQIDIVASEDGTTVIVTPTSDFMVGSVVTPAGTTITRTLNRGQTLKIMEAALDQTPSLSGTHIVADKPVAVTTSEDLVGHVGLMAYDMIGDQITPVDGLGTTYVIVKGYLSGQKELVYFIAAEDNTVLTINDGTVTTATIANKGDYYLLDLGTSGNAPPIAVLVTSNHPVYCYQITGYNWQLGSALLPSVYSISANSLSFYTIQPDASYSFSGALVFRAGAENDFRIRYGDGTYQSLAVTPIDIPGITDWKAAKVSLPSAARNVVVTLRNDNSAFSYGYYCTGWGSASYGFLSAVGQFRFAMDSVYICEGGSYFLDGGYAAGYDWELPDGTHVTTPTLTATQTGRYKLTIFQDPYTSTDSMWVYNRFDRSRIASSRPIDGGYGKRTYSVDFGSQSRTNVVYSWSLDGVPAGTGATISKEWLWDETGTVSVVIHDTELGCTKTLTLFHDSNHAWFVATDGSATNTGFSWDEPTTLETALAQSIPGDFVWIKEGIYTPAADSSFRLAMDGVEIYGGFAGDETYLYERNFAAHQSILRGNGNTVLQIANTNSEARIDGIVIENGAATDGGGIHLDNASPTIANVIIRKNTATGNGGGIYLESGSNPLIYNTEISGNTAAKGGGMYNDCSSPRLVNVTVGGNLAQSGGGMYNLYSEAEVANSIVAGNRSSVSKSVSVFSQSLLSQSKKTEDTGLVEERADGEEIEDDVVNAYCSPVVTTSKIGGGVPYQKSGFTNDGRMQEGDYRLRDNSMPLNAGSVSPVFALSLRWDTPLANVDLYATIRGLPYDLSYGERIIDDIIDMGAYEFGGERTFPTIMRMVTLPEVRGIATDPPAGRHYIPSQSDFVFTVTALDGYNLDGLTVTTGIPIRDREGIVITSNADGTKTVKILQVTEPLTLHISGFTGYTAIDDPAPARISTNGNNICIETPIAATVQIYTLAGQLYVQQTVAAGATNIAVAQGFYVVRLGGSVWKIIVRTN